MRAVRVLINLSSRCKSNCGSNNFERVDEDAKSKLAANKHALYQSKECGQSYSSSGLKQKDEKKV